MLWKTHIRIANEVLRRLDISKSSVEATRLREGSVTPDEWKDYPHHYRKSGSIQEYILKARRFFLKGDLPNACFHLGIALHYIQDSYTSLTARSDHHHQWEQQIEQSYFVNDLEKLVARSLRRREDLRNEYLETIDSFSCKIEGKKDTFRVATLHSRTFWWCPWSAPQVDLNFALRASLLVSKAVFNSRTYSKLQIKLSGILKEYKAKLRETEIAFSENIVELVKKRDELRKMKKGAGIFSSIRNFFLTLLSRTYNFRAELKMKNYEKQKHLRKVAEEYHRIAENTSAPHSDWFNITIPQIDITIVKKELLSTKEASEIFDTHDSVIQYMVKSKRISHLCLRNRELIRKSELREVLRA